jgi:hypothetical protein
METDALRHSQKIFPITSDILCMVHVHVFRPLHVHVEWDMV